MGNRANYISDKYIKEIGGNNKLAGIGPRLGKTPGLNSDNINQQQTVYAMLMLVNMSSLANTSVTPSAGTISESNKTTFGDSYTMPASNVTTNNSKYDSSMLNTLYKVEQDTKNNIDAYHYRSKRYLFNNDKETVKLKKHNYDDIVTFFNEKDANQSSLSETENHKKSCSDFITSSNQNDKNNKDYLFCRLKLFIKNHKKFKQLDDYDLAVCFLSKNKFEHLNMFEYLKTEESEKYPRLDKFSLKKITVLTNKNITSDINLKVYNLVTGKRNLAEFIPFIEQRGNTPDEMKFYDTYHLYKNAISGYSAGMKKDKVMLVSHIRVVSDELYATDKSNTKRIEYLKVELYHLTKLLHNRIDIEFRPLLVTSVLKNGYYYPPFEEISAGIILEKVVRDIQSIPDSYKVIYGPAYQARKSLLAYALYICGISSKASFDNSIFNERDNNGNRVMSDQDTYEYLINKTTGFVSTPGSNILQEVAQHYFYSVSVTLGYLPNPDIFLNVRDGEEKKLKDFTLRDKADSLRYYLRQDIDIAKIRVRQQLDYFLSIASLIAMFSNIINDVESMYTSRRNLILSGMDSNNDKGNNRIERPNKADYNPQYQSDVSSEYASRKNKAIGKIIALDKLKKIDVVEESCGPLKVWTQENKRADTLVLSGHGWYLTHDNNLNFGLIPKDKDIIFLGPNKDKLLEAEEQFGRSATESLFASGQYPEIHTRITSEGIQVLKKTMGEASLDEVKNYRIKYYEKTPDEEYIAAVKDNRINFKDNLMVDFSSVSEFEEEKKLSDIVKLMKPGKSIAHYKSIVFYACREYKGSGTLRSAASTSGLGGGYKIKFTETPLSMQGKPERKERDTLENAVSPDDLSFDGLVIIDKYTVTIGEWTNDEEPVLTYTADIARVAPYKNRTL